MIVLQHEKYEIRTTLMIIAKQNRNMKEYQKAYTSVLKPRPNNQIRAESSTFPNPTNAHRHWQTFTKTILSNQTRAPTCREVRLVGEEDQLFGRRNPSDAI